MSLTINTNVASLNAQRNLGSSQQTVNTAMQRLSSGLRINSAKDDAAGLAISDRMTSQVRGLNQAARNLNDGISMLQTAEGALQEVTNLIQRGRELSVQAANDATLSQSDKESLQAEVEQIKLEVDRIGKTTSFNGTKILDHGEGGTIAGDEDRFAIFESMKSSWLRNSEARIEEFYGLTAENVEITFAFEDDPSNGAAAYVGGPATLDANGLATSLTMTINMAHYDADSGYDYDRLIAHEMTHAVMAANMDFLDPASTKVESWFIEGTATFMSGYDDELKAAIDASGVSAVTAALPTEFGPISSANEYASSYGMTRFLHQEIIDAGGSGIGEMMSYMADNPGANLDAAFADLTATYGAGGFNYATSEIMEGIYNGVVGDGFLLGLDLTNTDVGAIGGADADGGAVLTNTSVISDDVQYDDDPLVGFNEVWFSEEELSLEEIASEDYAYQAGANAAQTIGVNLGSIDARVLNLADVDISTNAGAAIVRFDAALEHVDEMRGNMGAVMNRLESSIANIQNVAENLSAARSRILDADIAQETSTMTKSNILQQAGVSILAQANQAPQLALSLLG